MEFFLFRDLTLKVSSSFAIVAPRAYSPRTGESMLLVDLVNEELYSKTRTVRLVGQGSSMALAHLAAEFSANDGVRFLDGERLKDAQDWDLTVFAYSAGCKPDVELRLALWGQDEIIEYLVTKSPKRCKSVMARIMKSDDLWLGNGSPNVLSAVLDAMILSDGIMSVEEAILTHFDSLDMTETQGARINRICIDQLFNSEVVGELLFKIVPSVLSRSMIKFLSNQTVRYVFAARSIVDSVTSRRPVAPSIMNLQWPLSLVELVANKIQGNVDTIGFLNQIANNAGSKPSPNAASILICNDSAWRPTEESGLNISYAHLANASWSDVVAENSSLSGVNLSNADLRRANFTKSFLGAGNFHGANMTAAEFKYVYAWRSDFSEAILRMANADRASFKHADFENAIAENGSFLAADFTGANLRGANFSNTTLTNATFVESDMSDADFSNAILRSAVLDRLDLRSVMLDGADLTGATMTHCDMEGMQLKNAVFDNAGLFGAILTGTHFRSVSLQAACLHNAKLADVNWEGCDLQNAVFVDTHFQMGSTRCGLVDSPYPSHGTRTGFYTDDYNDQYFKRPEEIRKANLCSCDLRGANVTKSDFYLVDLRNAIYDEEQELHFQRCGAILAD